MLKVLRETDVNKEPLFLRMCINSNFSKGSAGQELHMLKSINIVLHIA